MNATAQAHLISSWGSDFRSCLLRMGEIRDQVPNPRWVSKFLLHRLPSETTSLQVALTATATEAVRREIATSLRMENPITFERPIARRNLYFDVVFQELLANPIENLLRFLDEKLEGGGCAIIYCNRKATTEYVCRALNSGGRQSLQYHGELPERNENQSRWMRGEVSAMVATVAFGLGIDRPDVRSVVHWGLPADMSSYFQEAGRGGRDGRPTWCRLYFSTVDRDRQEICLLRESGRSPAKQRKLADFRHLAATVVRSDLCRHAAFDEALESSTRRQTCDGMCDRCFDQRTLAAMVGELREPRRFPLFNRTKEQLGTVEEDAPDAAVCPMAEEVRQKCVLTREHEARGEPSGGEDDKQERRLGKRGRNVGDGADLEGDAIESANVAEYFHICGHCKAPNQQHIMNHLASSPDCLAEYCRSVMSEPPTDPPERKMVFQLALVMGACLNPQCPAPHYGRENLRDHVLRGPCRAFLWDYSGSIMGESMFAADLIRTAKRLYRQTGSAGSSILPYVPKRTMQRRKAAERQKLHRQSKRLEGIVDSSSAAHNMLMQQAEILLVPCSICRQQFSRPQRNQSGAAIRTLDTDERGEVQELLRPSLGGPKPEEHLRYDGQFWICSICRNEDTPKVRFRGNLEVFQSLQDGHKFTLRLVEVDYDDDDDGTLKSVVILTPSQHPTPDTDGKAVTLSSAVSLKDIFVMIPADISGADDFSLCHPSVQTTDWQNIAKLQASQNVLPGSLTLANVSHNCHQAQVHRAKIARQQRNEAKVFGTYRVTEDGLRKLDVSNISQSSQSATESLEQQDEDATKEYRDFVGALKDVAGSEDYFEAREKESRSRVDTFGAVRLQLKQKIFDGVDGKVGSRLINPALVKIVPQTDDDNKTVDYQCFLRCSDDGYRGCGEDCDKNHANLDDVADFADPNFVLKRLPLLARYVSACAECFVGHIVKDRVSYYDFWLQYEEGAVFLVGNVWLKQYEALNAEIASLSLTGYTEVAEKIEEINFSSTRPFVPTATLDEGVLAAETRGAIKDLRKVKENVLKKQTADELQGLPSLASFFPRHKGHEVDALTKENAAYLLEYAARERPDASLDDVLQNVSFSRQPALSADKVKFVFRLESLSQRDTTVLFFTVLCRATTLDMSGEPVLKLCTEIASEEQRRQAKRFEKAATPLVMYDALQAARNEYQAVLQLFAFESVEDVVKDSETFKHFMTQLGQRLYDSGEDWHEIEADRTAMESLRATLEMQLGRSCSDAEWFYHTALDLHQASSNEGFTLRRSCRETHVRAYEAFSFAAFGKENEVRLLLPGEDAWTVSRPPTVDLCGSRYFQMPILQLALLKSGGKAVNRFSNCGPVRWVDLRDGRDASRSYRELKRGEDVGQQQVWHSGGKRYVLSDGWRSFYMMLPEQLSANITMAELCGWYDKADNVTAVELELLKSNQGFLGPHTDDQEHERILKGENETKQRDALLPSKILLKNGVTVLKKRKSPVAMLWESLGLQNEFHEKAFFTAWKNEEEIYLKEASMHGNDIWRFYFTGRLTTSAPNPSRSEDPSDSWTSFSGDNDDMCFNDSSQFVTSTPVTDKTVFGRRRRPLHR